jgi:sortase (surface protein transpeptidase)
MDRILRLVRTRLLPAALTAAGVALITAGLVTYTDATLAGIPPTPSPAPSIVEPTASPSVAPSASHEASPSPSAEPSEGPSAPTPRRATRIAIPALQIDLPVIMGTPEYPLCNVAMFIADLGQPGGDRATYLYAHARKGMFLPLLEQSERRNGAAMIGMLVQVWTSDEQLFLYEITEVRRHQTDLEDAANADHDQLWLQTSEGPRGTVPKLQVVAEPLSNGPAADPKDANPIPKPVVCG